MYAMGASFYDQYIKPYVASAAQGAAIDIAMKQFIDRGMSQEEAYKAAYQLVTGTALPIVPTSFWDKSILGIKMPVLLAGGVAAFILFGVIKGKK